MVALKKLIAPVLAGAALALGSASAFALNVGDKGSLAEMQTKLANENQVEIVNAATGTSQALRGVKFYYNKTSKVSYIALTDDPVRPTQMRIIFQATNTEPEASDIFGDSDRGNVRCQMLINENLVKPDNCASFKIRLDGARRAGMAGFQQGTMPTLNVLTSFMNMATGVGVVYETTRDGAAVSKLVLANAKPTEDGARLIASLQPQARKTALNELNTPTLR